MDCGHIFVVPTFLQQEFGYISKFALFGGQYDTVPLPFNPIVPLFFYIPLFDHVVAYLLSRNVQTLEVPIHDTVPTCIRQEIDGLFQILDIN